MTPDHTCKGCGAEIIWRRLSGRWHPCDPKKFTIVIDEDGGRLVSGYESHFATCPKAGEFRKQKGSDSGQTQAQRRTETKTR